MNRRLHQIRAYALAATMLVVLAWPVRALAASSSLTVTSPVSVTNSATSSATTAASTTGTATAPPVTIPTTASSGLSALQELGIAVAALIVFGSIAYVIRRDAHLHAPRHASRDIDRERGTMAPRTERIKRSRAKAKAARRARRSRR